MNLLVAVADRLLVAFPYFLHVVYLPVLPENPDRL
jgi:hypothetical protein